MSLKDLQEYKLETREDFAQYLKFIIQYIQSNLHLFRTYLEELKIIVNNEQPTIPYRTYEDHRIKLGLLSLFLSNIFADHSTAGVSYKKCRKALNKKSDELSINIQPLPNEIGKLLNDFYNFRNWSAHVPESLIQSIIINKMIFHQPLQPSPMIDIETYSLYEFTWIVSLYRENERLYNDFRKVFSYVKKDYSRIIGSTMEVRLIKNNDIPKPFDRYMMNNSISMNIQRNSVN